MPRGDSTGPAGMGPMTGRAAGYCAGYQTPGYANSARGRGFWGCGRGGGRGWRNWFRATGLPWWARAGYGFPAGGPVPMAPYAPAADRGPELEDLREQAGFFERALGEIRRRIDQLESEHKE